MSRACRVEPPNLKEALNSTMAPPVGGEGEIAAALEAANWTDWYRAVSPENHPLDSAKTLVSRSILRSPHPASECKSPLLWMSAPHIPQM